MLSTIALVNAIQPDAALLDATYTTRRYPTLPYATQRCSTLLDATIRYPTLPETRLPDATRWYPTLPTLPDSALPDARYLKMLL
jgi:hypothetical protein